LLKNNIQLEGIVENWDKDAILRSLDGKSLIIIPHPDDDIVVIRIILQESPIKIKDLPPKNEVEKEIENIVEKTTSSDDYWRLKRLAELRKELVNQDKKIVSEKLRSHSVTETNKVSYGLPGFLTIKSPK